MKVRLFDVCVLGRSLGGLVAAVMLQRRGARVLVLNDREASKFEPVLCEFLNGFTLKPILKRVGFHPTEVNAIPSLDAPLQLIFPKRRMDCYGEEEKFEREVTREFPDIYDRILHLFKESYGHLEVYQHLFNSRTPFPPKNMLARRRFQQMLSQVCEAQLLENRKLEEELKAFQVGREFSQAIEAMELALTSLVTPWTCGAHLAHLLTLVRWEGYASPSGPVSIRDMFLQKIQERGGHVCDYDEIKDVSFDRKSIQGFALSGSEWEEVRCRVAIVAGEPRGLIQLAPNTGKFKQWRSQLDELPVFARKAFMIFRLPAEGIPVGMKPQGIIIPQAPKEGLPERRRRVRAIRYAIRWHSENGRGPESWLCVTAYLDPDNTEPDQRVTREEVKNVLRGVIPFLDECLMEDAMGPFIPHGMGRAGDFRQAFVYTSKTPRYLGVYGLSPETPFKNTFQASDMVFPGLGLDGEVLAGLHVAHWSTNLLSTGQKQIP